MGWSVVSVPEKLAEKGSAPATVATTIDARADTDSPTNATARILFNMCRPR